VVKYTTIHKIEDDINEVRHQAQLEYSDEKINAIQNYSAVACVNTSVKRSYMGALWIISNEVNEFEIIDEIWLNRCGRN